MGQRGGSRIGSGRKSKAVELGIAGLAREAIESKYGSLKQGFEALLETDDTMLIKFVFEHAAGKPKDVVDITTDGEKINSSPNLSDAQFSKLLTAIDEKSNPG